MRHEATKKQENARTELRERIAENLRDRRERKHLTQPEVAERCNISNRSLIYRYETGRVVPSVERLADLATVLGCKPADLLR